MKTIIINTFKNGISRFPGKPMAKIDGKPMIQRVWEQAINCNIGEV